MAVIPEQTKCNGCKKMVFGTWQTKKGKLCDKCLVEKVPLPQALKDTCECMHNKIKELYASAEQKKKQETKGPL